jgi:16S rRNA processing protein RimM
MEKILIATILKPHGIKGDLKIKFYADSFQSIKGVKTVFIDNKEYSVGTLKLDGSDFAFLSLSGVTDRNFSELLRGKEVYAYKNQIKKSATSFFIADLIGLNVFINEEMFGTVKDVIQSNVDMFVISLTNNKVAYLPFLKSLNLKIDIENKTLNINGNDYEKVIFYED